MRMKSILTIALSACLSFPTYGMRPQNHLKRPLHTTKSSYEPIAKKQMLNNEANALMNKLEQAIEHADLTAINGYLSSNDAKILDVGQKKSLYMLAQKRQNEINVSIIGLSHYREVHPNNANANVELSSLQTQQPHIRKIIELLDAFIVLPIVRFPLALFTPRPYDRLIDKRPDLDETLNALIANEKEKIYVCSYHMNLPSVTDALIHINSTGIPVDVITDKKNVRALSALTINGITVRAPRNDDGEEMHHKFFIFKNNILNKSLLWTGSYNSTPHGNMRSWDDAIIIDDPDIITEYIKRFEEVKSRCR